MPKRLLAAVLITVLLMSCAGANAANKRTLSNIIDSSVRRDVLPAALSNDGTIEENPVIDGENGLSGLKYAGQYIPIMLTIDNVKAARPQWGIGKADIVYEMLVNGYSLTRLLVLFGGEKPQSVGPIRSARFFHADMRQQWDAAMLYAGYQAKKGTNFVDRLKELGVTKSDVTLTYNLLFLNKAADHSQRVKIHSAPHNVDVNLAEVEPLFSDYTFVQHPFLFADAPLDIGEEATKVFFDFGENDNTDSQYEYDAEKNAYLRFINDAPYTDYNDPDTQLSYANVIVQRVNVSFYNRDSARPVLELVGSGNADIFTGGRYIKGTWYRSDINARTVYLDENGNELALQRGASWIAVVSDRTVVSYE